MTSIRTYFTFYEWLAKLQNDYYHENLVDVLYDAIATIDGETLDVKLKPVLHDLLLLNGDMGIAYKDWIPFIETEPSIQTNRTLYDEITEKVLRKFSYVYNTTKDRYLTLIDIYTNQKANLLNKVESNSIQRYNDTPQNGGDWSDDEHTSNITRTESSNDFTPLMDRINEIQNKLRNIQKDWEDEFKGIFITIPEE